MREIKFRAWDIFYKKFVYSHDCVTENRPQDAETLSTFFAKVAGGRDAGREVPVMQFTGLRDKDGREIYEGDVVRWSSWKLGSRMASPNSYKVDCVEWDGEGFWRVPSSSFVFGIYSDVEVIGNIYENPEPLEGRQRV